MLTNLVNDKKFGNFYSGPREQSRANTSGEKCLFLFYFKPVATYTNEELSEPNGESSRDS